MSTEATVKINPADRARAIRLFLHRRLDVLWKRVTDPAYTGFFLIEQHTKEGRPFDPKTGDTRMGIFDE